MIPVAGVIYIFHLYAFGFLGLSVGLLELHRWWHRERSASALAKVLAGGLAVAVGPALQLIASTSGAAGIDLGETSFGELGPRLLVPLAPFVSMGFPQHSLDPTNMALAQMIMLYWLLLFGTLTYRLRAPADRILQFAPETGLALIGTLVLTLCMPSILGAVHFTHIRFPVLFLCLLLAVTNLRMSRSLAVAFTALIVGSTALRVGWLEGKWQEHDTEVRELLTLERHLDGEDQLLLARAGNPGDVLLHSHSTAHLVRRTGLFFPGIFSGGNSLSPRPEVALRDVTQSYPIEIGEIIAEARAPRAPEGLADSPGQRYWADWQSFYSHVLVLGAPGAKIEAAPELGRLVQRGSFFALFETAPR
jgi:hypothetical protein